MIGIPIHTLLALVFRSCEAFERASFLFNDQKFLFYLSNYRVSFCEDFFVVIDLRLE
jgi:hypothetical protein